MDDVGNPRASVGASKYWSTVTVNGVPGCLVLLARVWPCSPASSCSAPAYPWMPPNY